MIFRAPRREKLAKAGEELIPKEALEYLGRMDPPEVMEVEKGSIRRYADAVGNDNPLYRDEEHVWATRYGSIIAPPGFFGWPKKPGLAIPALISEVIAGMAKVGYPRLLAGGMAYEFYLPVRAGDILVFSIKVKEMSEKEGKGGISMIITIFEKSYLNQSGDLVAKCDHTLIFRQ